MNSILKYGVNSLLSNFGLRLISANWGPRGYISAFNRLKKMGIVPKTIFDVGASDGSWSKELSKVFPNSSYHLFEPLEEYSATLTELTAKKGKFLYHPVALGSKSGILDFNAHHGQSSFLSCPTWASERRRIEVKTIDELVQGKALPNPDLIKADIQGYELELLKGAENVLSKCSFLFLEVSWLQIYDDGPYAGEILGWLATRDFHVFDICSYSMRPIDGRLVQSDILLAHLRTKLFCEKRRS